MGLFGKVNDRYIKTFYSREFDKDWKIYGNIPQFDVFDVLIEIHRSILAKLNSKKDIFVDGPDGLALLVDAMIRNKIPVDPKAILVPTMVQNRYGVTPASPDFKKFVQEMVDSGEIPKALLEHLPKHLS
jgi:hypothetical protein